MAYLRNRGEQRELDGSNSVPDWVSGDAGVVCTTTAQTRLRDFRRIVQIFIGHRRSTCSLRFFKELKILWAIAASHRPSHWRTAQETPFRSGSSTNVPVRSHSDPGDLGMVNTKSSQESIVGQDSQSIRVC